MPDEETTVDTTEETTYAEDQQQYDDTPVETVDQILGRKEETTEETSEEETTTETTTNVDPDQPTDQQVKDAVEDGELTQQADGTFTVKVDGEEKAVTIEDLKRAYGKATSADKKFQDAAMMRKQSEGLLHLLKTDPMKVLTHPELGLDFKSLAEQYLAKQIEMEMMDPKDKELHEAKEKLRQAEFERQQAEQARQQQEYVELTQKYEQEITADIHSALETSGLPKTQQTVSRMATYMYQGMQHGASLKAADVVDLVREDYIADIKTLFGGVDTAKLMELLGNETVGKIRKHDVDTLKGKQQQKASEVKQVVQPKPKKKKMTKEEQIAMRDWFLDVE